MIGLALWLKHEGSFELLREAVEIRLARRGATRIVSSQDPEGAAAGASSDESNNDSDNEDESSVRGPWSGRAAAQLRSELD